MSADQAFALLEPYFPCLRTIVDGGWRFWNSFPPEARLKLDVRAQRSVTWCGMIAAAVDELSEHASFTVIKGTNTTYFSIDGKAIIRFKKLDRSGTSANVMTQLQLDLRDPQVSLGGPFGQLPFLDVGYVPNNTETGYDAILVASPGDNGSAWNFAIPAAAEQDLVTPIEPSIEETAVRPIVRPKTDAETGTEGQ